MATMIDQARTRPVAPDTAEPGFVWVYQYMYWDEASQSHQTSDRFATLDVIHCGLGVPIPKSGKKITVSQLIDGAFSE